VTASDGSEQPSDSPDASGSAESGDIPQAPGVSAEDQANAATADAPTDEALVTQDIARGQQPVLADNGQIVTDTGNSYGDANFGKPIQPDQTSEDMFNALTQAMQNPAPAAGDSILLDDFGNPVYPNLVTDEQVTGAEGTLGLRATGAVHSAYADALNLVQTMDIKPIFDQNNPHQYLLLVADDGTRNDASQAIPTNPRTLFNLAQEASNDHACPI
jgi:hypothetical protein